MAKVVKIKSPSGSDVRIVDGRIIYTDLGLAMDRTRAFAAMVMTNNPSLQAVGMKVKVDGSSREGWSLGEDGLRLLLSIMDGHRSKTPAGEGSMDAFMGWARTDLMTAVREAAKGVVSSVPKRIVIDLADDNSPLKIQVEMSNGRKIDFHP